MTGVISGQRKDAYIVMSDDVAIIGFGYVGKAIHLIFPDALIYDPLLQPREEATGTPLRVSTPEQINAVCKLAIICVPTPMIEDTSAEFKPVDLRIVEAVVSWLQVPYILLKSTVPPGTTSCLEAQTGKNICFSPEYVGEGTYHVSEWRYMSPKDPRNHDFLIVGGRPGVRDKVAEFFVKRLGPEKFYYLVDSVEAELIKYMENCWGAMKVVFAAEFYQLCLKTGASYMRVREGWALDNRVERMHTAVFPGHYGFDGKCYPKDLNGIVCCADEVGAELSLIKAILRRNREIQSGFCASSDVSADDSHGDGVGKQPEEATTVFDKPRQVQEDSEAAVILSQPTR